MLAAKLWVRNESKTRESYVLSARRASGMANRIQTDSGSAGERLIEIAEILAAGLMLSENGMARRSRHEVQSHY
jgi:hypothetical protein